VSYLIAPHNSVNLSQQSSDIGRIEN